MTKQRTPGLLQPLVLLIIAAVFLYAFYLMYVQYRDYRTAGQIQKAGNVDVTPVDIPEFYSFQPAQDQLNKFKLFSFKDQKEDLKGKGGSDGKGAGDKNNGESLQKINYTLLGVVKRDHLFLVVRFNDNSTIKLYAVGDRIEGNGTLKKLTARKAVLEDASGTRTEVRVFKLEPTTIFQETEVKKKIQKAGKK